MTSCKSMHLDAKSSTVLLWLYGYTYVRALPLNNAFFQLCCGDRKNDIKYVKITSFYTSMFVWIHVPLMYSLKGYYVLKKANTITIINKPLHFFLLVAALLRESCENFFFIFIIYFHFINRVNQTQLWIDL